jgi:hypothetical protein
MKVTLLQAQGHRACFLLLAAVALTSSGCLAVAASAAGGAAVAGYAYARGKVCHTFSSTFNDTWAATRQSLTELGMPIQEEERPTSSSGFLKTESSEGAVRIYIESVAGETPADPGGTQVCIRVATFGDYPVSDRILSQMSSHLVPRGSNPGAWAPATPAAGAIQTPHTSPPPVPGQPPPTAPPPLLTPEPAK